MTTRDMNIYLEKERLFMTSEMTITHAAGKRLAEKVESHGHMGYLEVFWSDDIFSDLTKKNYQFCRERECHRSLLAACFSLVSHLIYPLALKMERGHYSEMPMIVIFMRSACCLPVAGLLFGLL